MVGTPRVENVLKRAEELEAINKAPAALDALYETITSRRSRAMSLEQLEPVFAKFLSLAVELRKGKVIKDGLHQYKKLVLPLGDDGVASLVTSINGLLQQSTEAVNRARQQADEVQVEDLEEESPQDLMLALVSNDEAKDRTDREVVTPWLKFLWENYRSILDVLRNNSKLEVAYADVTSQAFKFCNTFSRKTEFRRLAELLRTHLQYASTQSRTYHADLASARQQAVEHAGTKSVTPQQVAMYMPPNAPQNPIDLSDANTLQRFLDTRFEQLEHAVKLELWQETYRSVEDVHTLLNATHRPIPVSCMATYYETLARVFSVSKNHLFHAATWLKYFAMVSSRRAPEEDLRRIASFCVMGLLCVPHDAQPLPVNGRTRRWMALINLQRCPTRKGLIEAALSRNVLHYARQEVCDLFNLFERDFNSLTLCDELKKLSPALVSSDDLKSYWSPLLEVAAASVFNELAQSYTEIKLDFVMSLLSFPAPFEANKYILEKLLVSGSAQTYRVRIDHERGVVRFVDSLSYPSANTAGALVRSELYELACALKVVANPISEHRILSGTDAKAALIAERREFQVLQEREQYRIENAKKAKQLEEEEKQRERARKAQEARIAAELSAAQEEAKRAEAALAKEMAAVALAEKKKLAETINMKGHVHVDLNDLENISMEQLQKMQVEQLDQETRSLDARMSAVTRRYDHLERALRQEEAKLWQEDAKKQSHKDREIHDRRVEALLTGSRRSFEEARAYAERFSRIRNEYKKFTTKLYSDHKAMVAAKRATNLELLEKEKAERIVAVTEARRAAEAKRIAEEKRREEQRKIDEKRRAEEAEREKQAQLAREREQKEAEARREASRLKAEKIRQELAQKRAAASQGTAKPAAPGTPSPSGGSKYVPPSARANNPFGQARVSSVNPSASKPDSSPFGKIRSLGSPAATTPPPEGGKAPSTSSSGKFIPSFKRKTFESA